MNFLEKDLEQIIYDAPPDQLRKRGLHMHYHYKARQLNLGAYGVADIVTVSFLDKTPVDDTKQLLVRVYELKQKRITINTLLQAARYCKGIEKFLSNNYNLSRTNLSFRICLIGREINVDNDFVYLSDLLHEIELITYDYGFDGIKFTEHKGYYLTKPMFPAALKDIVEESAKCGLDTKICNQREFEEIFK